MTEIGGPPPAPTPKAGFGTFLIEKLLVQHDGEATVAYGVEGLSCILKFTLPDADRETLADEKGGTAYAAPVVVTGEPLGSGS